MTTADLIGLAGFIAVCFLAAASGAYFRPGAWYKALRKPDWTPPDWLFPIAWSILYLMIAISGWLVWRENGFSGAPYALAAYGAHLLFNALWSGVFFGARRIDLAFADVVLMWLSLALTMMLFLPVSPLAVALLAPYLAWVSFAGLLNLTIWRLNPSTS